MKVYRKIFEEIISLENLFSSWDKFKRDKQKKQDVQQFEWRLEQNIFKLYRDLKHRKYKHARYISFYISDPKQRHIHKASVRDRVVHHAVFAVINLIFEPSFIPTSFSCRIGKGTHKGVDALESMIRKVSRNYTRSCFVLKCDIKKFFATIDHRILLDILKKRIKDKQTLWLLKEIIESFNSEYSKPFRPKGLPIGNLTSQLFANIYLNELDQFIKHQLKIKYYVRYTDDFVIAADNESYLHDIVSCIDIFLTKKLKLVLHPNKIAVRKYYQGIDFLGHVLLPHYRVLRAKTKQRIFRDLKQRVKKYKLGIISEQTLEQCLQSYLGVFSHTHTHTYKLSQELKNQFWFWLTE